MGTWDEYVEAVNTQMRLGRIQEHIDAENRRVRRMGMGALRCDVRRSAFVAAGFGRAVKFAKDGRAREAAL